MSRWEQEATIVIPNGYNLNKPDWRFVVEGDLADGRLGRIPKAIHVAMTSRADHMLWNTGASKTIVRGEELYEGDMMHRLALENMRIWMNAFPQFDHFSYKEIMSFLEDSSKHHFERRSQDTMTSAFEAVPILDEIIGTRSATVISVSSRNHDRAGHHFDMVLREGYVGHGPLKSKDLTVLFARSDTGYRDDGPMDRVKITECSGADQYAARYTPQM